MPEQIRIAADARPKDRGPGWRTSLTVRRPLLLLMLVITAGRMLGSLRCGVWLGLPLTALLLLATVHFLSIRPVCLRWLLPFLFLFVLVNQLTRHLPAQAAAEALHGQRLVLAGRVLDATDPERSYDQTVFQMDQGGRLWLRGPAADLICGSRIQAVVDCLRPQGPRNPGGFDQAAWLRSSGIYLTAEVVEDTAVDLLKAPNGLSLKRLAWEQRKRLIRRLHRWLPDQPAALTAAILLGDRSYLSVMDQAVLRKAGLTHLTAVSGTHVALLIWPVQSLLARLIRHRLTRRLILAASLLAFGCLTGWPLSVSRAILMQGLILTAAWGGRRADRLNSLGGAAALIMLLQPDAALQTGFWLSVSATLVLIVLVPHLAESLTARWSCISPELARLMVLPPAIQLALLPLSIGLSGELVWSGWLSSWLVLPLIQLLLPYSLFWLLLSGLLPLSGCAVIPLLLRLTVWPIRLGAGLLMKIALFCARLPLPRLLLGDFSVPLWLLFLALMLSACGLWRQAADFFGCSRCRQKKVWQTLCLVLSAATLLAACLRPLLQPPADVWFFDVGQGDATLLRSRNDSILVDGGPAGSGCRDVLPALDALGLNQVNLAIVTHGHADHCGGIAELLQLRRISCLALPEWLLAPDTDPHGGWQAADLPEAEEKAQIQQLIDLAKQASIPVQALRISDTINAGRQLCLRVLPLPRSALSVDDGNARSLLMIAESAGYRLLLTADCTGTVENALLDSGSWPDADLLKVAHHGSASATGREFLQVVQPDAAIISVGQYNRYGHPSPALLERLDGQAVSVWRTDLHGAVHWQIRGSRWRLSAMAGQPAACGNKCE